MVSWRALPASFALEALAKRCGSDHSSQLVRGSVPASNIFMTSVKHCAHCCSIDAMIFRIHIRNRQYFKAGSCSTVETVINVDPMSERSRLYLAFDGLEERGS